MRTQQPAPSTKRDEVSKHSSVITPLCFSRLSNSIAPEWIAAPARALATSYDKIQNSSKMSRIRQNYREETEALVNQQINIQLTASYAYQVRSLEHFSIFCIRSSTNGNVWLIQVSFLAYFKLFHKLVKHVILVYKRIQRTLLY